ncbi:Conjugal transfer protein TraG [Methyloligella halotolerans]|uniref:Conjugal transfer protein TraG n=2 Tax=Methyloligella halotolerans TaxID=1177755 RepID=A0A1E2RVG1_9HYPH|nr:Conjugal transfer protein TraG [Methyloligella halotolerans]
MENAASLSLDWTPASLTLGFTDDASQRPVYFNGNESLITAGGPGSYKTTSQVIRNLLTYPGSAIVLDVKGELWEQTAGHRAAHFGPVYRFSPADKDQRSHRYNPFDFISDDPAQATADCDAFGYEIISDNPDTRDPYWQNRARNFLWAFATMIAISTPKSLRNLAHLAQCLNISTIGTKEDGVITLASSTEAALKLLSALGDKHDIPDLRAVSDAIRAGIGLHSNRGESILDIARNHLAPFSQRRFVQEVTRTSDWHPLDFRRETGTTLYLNVSTSDLPSFSPLLRLMIYQHMRILLDHVAAPGEPPITFFLDELPQLGNFKSILQMQAVGRSAGLRLWMFVQNLRQLYTAYGLEAGRAIPEDARVRCYMKPDESIAEHIARTLGETENLFTGERRSLATAAEIRGPKFRNKTFVFASEDYPVILERRPAFQDLGYLVQEPPEVPQLRTSNAHPFASDDEVEQDTPKPETEI